MKGLLNYKVPEVDRNTVPTSVERITEAVQLLEQQQQELINNPEIASEDNENDSEDVVGGADDDEISSTSLSGDEHYSTINAAGGNDGDATTDDTSSALDPLEESWREALSGALHSLPSRMQPILDVANVPSRCFKGVSRNTHFILVVVEGEWEIATIYSPIKDDCYRLKLYFTHEWAVARLDISQYGRDNPSENRWLLLKEVDDMHM